MKKGKDRKGNGICRKNEESIRGSWGCTEKGTGENEEVCR